VSVSPTLSSQPDSTARERPANPTLIAGGLAAIGPAAITFYLAFRSGGFFAGAPAIVAVILGVALTARVVLAEQPFEGFGPALVWAATGLGLFTIWTLTSALWSHAPAQALIEFDRALMYWLALVLFGSFAWSRERLLWAVRALTLAMVLVAVAGLATRILPELHSVQASIENDRLSYPLSYWNGLGIFAAVTIVFCVGLATRREEPPVFKALAAAAVPLVTATLYFCFSRGPTGALAIGLVLFILLCRRRELVGSALAILPPTIVAVLLCLGTHTLSTAHYSNSSGVSEGHTLTLELIGCALAAAALRLLLAGLDRRLDRVEISATRRRRAWTIVGTTIAVVVIVVGIAVDAPSRISSGFESFTETKSLQDPHELQDRFTTVNNNGRLVQWELALENFGNHPLLGSGAGTYGRLWAKEGDEYFKVVNTHSVYFEAMSNLGAPGLIFLLVGLFSILVGMAMRIRGPDRILYAALFAAVFTWAIHAGVDWDWEMPATGFFIFGLGGIAIAARPQEQSYGEDDGGPGSSWLPRAPGRTVRIALGIGCLVLVVTPALVAVSQEMLDSAVNKFKEGNCGGASQEALDSIHVLSVRPDPYQVIGFCDMSEGQDELAVSLLETAVNRDEGEWESWYGLAVVQAAAGEDPRAAAAKAYELAPHEPLAEEGHELFSAGNPKIWKRRAETARLPIS
jgi:O-antigen ligase